jgi:spore coat protein A, manganese oxidase
MSDRTANLMLLVLTLTVSAIVLLPAISTAVGGDGATQSGKDLDPSLIPKFANQLTGPPPVFIPTKILDPVSGEMTDYYSIIETEVDQQILPAYDSEGNPTGLGSTKVWTYGGLARDAVTYEELGFVRGTPSATIEATRGVPVNVAWVNGIVSPLSYAVDPTIDPTNSGGTSFNISGYNDPTRVSEGAAIFPVTTTTHLQGGEVSSKYDGVPYSWVSWNGFHGSDYSTYARTLPNSAVYHYDNDQAPGTLWFRDRAFGMTRSNVYSGLSGFYILRDPADQIPQYLPHGKYEMPLSIQDRNFHADGSLKLPSETPVQTGTSSSWLSQYYGDVILVNGLAWPNMNVDRGQYTFKILDGSDARWYDLSLSNGMPFTVIAADGNYLRNPLTITSLTIAPGERYDVLVDFSICPPGTEITLTNRARTPYPNGSPVDPTNDGVVMKFTVGGGSGYISRVLPKILNPNLDEVAALGSSGVQRSFTLVDYVGQIGNSMSMLDGQLYKSSITEYPKAGTEEIWRIIDVTENSHQIHVDLVGIQVLSRQRIDAEGYRTGWLAANGGSLPLVNQTRNIDLQAYLLGEPVSPAPIEDGLRDSVRVDPGEVVTILVRFAPADDRSSYPFDPSGGPTYIWNSNIFDHDDNEMMRQFVVVQ